MRNKYLLFKSPIHDILLCQSELTSTPWLQGGGGPGQERGEGNQFGSFYNSAGESHWPSKLGQGQLEKKIKQETIFNSIHQGHLQTETSALIKEKTRSVHPFSLVHPICHTFFLLSRIWARKGEVIFGSSPLLFLPKFTLFSDGDTLTAFSRIPAYWKHHHQAREGVWEYSVLSSEWFWDLHRLSSTLQAF